MHKIVSCKFIPFSGSVESFIGDYNRFITQNQSMSTIVSLIGNRLIPKVITMRRQLGK
jgi:hypothetical protein